MSDYILVRYARNAEGNSGTGALRHIDDDRPDLNIGEAGYVSEDELHNAARFGVILEPLEEGDLQKYNLVEPVHPDDYAQQEDGGLSEEQSMADLQKVAKDEGVDTKGLRSKADVIDAIQTARSAQPEGAGSLPATATLSPPTPSVGGATGDASDSGGGSTPAGATS